MKRAISWFAENGVAANLLLLVIAVSGVVTIFRLKMEIFPELDPRLITVTVEYRGASPEEV